MTMNRDFHFFDYLTLLAKWGRLLLFVGFISAITSVVAVLLMPVWYASTVTIMPPKTPDLIGLSSGGARSALQRLAMGGQGGLTSMGGYNYLAILSSRELTQSIIDSFRIRERYELADDLPWERVHEALLRNVSIGVDRNDFIAITVEDQDPEVAAAMASYYVALLNQRSAELGSREASANRQFLESRISDVRHKLAHAEDSLKGHFVESEFFMLPDQGGSLGALSDLYAQKISREVEFEFLRRNLPASDPSVQRARFEIDQLEQRIKGIPDAGITSLRLYRDVVILQRMLEFLTPLYEQAKLEEQRDTPVVIVLDNPAVAEKKSRPPRTLYVLFSVAGAMMLAIGYIILYERVWSIVQTDEAQQARLVEFKTAFQAIFRRRA
jgi:tyrosine-protein kinase Etk/Wzc